MQLRTAFHLNKRFKVHVSSFYSIQICKICRASGSNVLDPPPFRPVDPPLLKSDDLFLGNQEILDPPFKNPGHAPVDILVSHTRSHCRITWVYINKREFKTTFLEQKSVPKSMNDTSMMCRSMPFKCSAIILLAFFCYIGIYLIFSISHIENCYTCNQLVIT